MCKYKKEELEDLILVQKLPYTTIAKQYQCSDNNIKKWAKKFEILLPKKRTVNPVELLNRRKIYKCLHCKEVLPEMGKYKRLYCSKICEQAKKKAEWLDVFLNNNDSCCYPTYTSIFLKPYLLEQQGGKCIICSQTATWNGKNLVLILDHINGDASNNHISNLRLVCPNCDSQLDTYKSKNKNSARKERYLKSYKN